MRRASHRFCGVAIGALLSLLAAAAQAASIEELGRQLRQIGVDPEGVVVPFELTPEIRVWQQEELADIPSSRRRVESLLVALQDPKGKSLEYDRGYTGTAPEVFTSGRYNCLGFSYLFVGLAREMGIDAYFLRVNRIERFGMQGSFVVVSSHVTAAYGPPMDRVVLEFGFESESEYRTATPISDLEAISLYYSNRGTELLREGRTEEALEWLEMAVRIGPRVPDGWLNLGVAQRRLGALDEAEEAYRAALDLDGSLLPAYYNLSVLFRLRGDPDAAQQMVEIVDRRSNKNPFTYVSLGDLSMRHGNTQEAFRYYQRALQLDRRRSEVPAAMGLWALETGDLPEARRRLERALEIDSENRRAAELAERLAAAQSAAAGSTNS